LCHGDRGAGTAAGGALPGVLDPGEVQAAAAEAAAWQVHAAFGQQGHPHTVLLCEGLPSPVNTSSDTHLPSEGFRRGHAAGGSPGRLHIFSQHFFHFHSLCIFSLGRPSFFQFFFPATGNKFFPSIAPSRLHLVHFDPPVCKTQSFFCSHFPIAVVMLLLLLHLLCVFAFRFGFLGFSASWPQRESERERMSLKK